MRDHGSGVSMAQAYATQKQAAEFCGVSTHTLRTWERTGVIEAAVRVGTKVNGRGFRGVVLYRLVELQASLDKHRQVPE